MFTVALDMDGVLADLELGVFQKLGFKTPNEGRDKLFKKILPEYVRQNGFAESPVLEGAEDLVGFLVDLQEQKKINIVILTSTGHFYHPNSNVARQKKEWLEKYFPELYMVPFICTTSGKSKSILAHKDIILIDDHQPNVVEFCGSGGLAIHYKPDELEWVKNQILALI